MLRPVPMTRSIDEINLPLVLASFFSCDQRSCLSLLMEVKVGLLLVELFLDGKMSKDHKEELREHWATGLETGSLSSSSVLLSEPYEIEIGNGSVFLLSLSTSLL